MTLSAPADRSASAPSTDFPSTPLLLRGLPFHLDDLGAFCFTQAYCDSVAQKRLAGHHHLRYAAIFASEFVTGHWAKYFEDELVCGFRRSSAECEHYAFAGSLIPVFDAIPTDTVRALGDVVRIRMRNQWQSLGLTCDTAPQKFT